MCLPIFVKMITTMIVKKEAMYKAAQGGFTNATDIADYLVKKGLPFRSAHEIIGKMVLYCINHGKAIEELSMDELEEFSDKIEADIYDEISLEKCVSGRSLKGGPAADSVREAIASGHARLEAEESGKQSEKKALYI